MFLAEKDLHVHYQEIDLLHAENRAPAFRKINPLGTLPVLELDDGSHIAETMAICRYFEDLQPMPSLFGRDVRERAIIEMWNRRMEFEILEPIADAFRHRAELFSTRLMQVPQYAGTRRRQAQDHLAWVDDVLADQAFVAGDGFSVADITAFCGIDLGKVSGILINPSQSNLLRWYETVSSRASAKA